MFHRLGLLRLRRLAAILCLCIAVVLLLNAYSGRSISLYKSAVCSRYVSHHHTSPPIPRDCPVPPPSHTARTPQHTGLSSALSPAELLCRPAAPVTAAVPKLLHQSWKSTELPAKFEGWSNTCREQHPDWEWVLWTDEDNLQLVRNYFPWLEDTFVNLPGNIYRVDLARNLYMYMFGGVYADLDTECLRPTLDALEAHNISLPDTVNKASRDGADMGRVAMFGRMGSDPTFEHHVPNAWMAASPRHPFFLFPLESARAEIEKSRSILHKLWYDYPSAEQLTGPIALRENILRYESCGNSVDKIILLPDGLIYPFNWNTEEELRSICSAEKDTFDESRCKDMLNVHTKGSISITYWSHTHRGKGADVENIARISQEKQ